MHKVILSSLVAAIMGGTSTLAPEPTDIIVESPKLSPLVKIAVIDTGIDPYFASNGPICQGESKDFVGTGIVDNHGHGTHISGLIDQYAKDDVFEPGEDMDRSLKIPLRYCQMILKYYDPKQEADNLELTIKALRYAIDHKANIINYSGGGTEYSQQEHDLIIEALDKGIKIVAAAGNEHSDIDKHPYYPAMYDKRIYVVGNLAQPQSQELACTDKGRKIACSSNFGDSVNTWEIGDKVLSRLPGHTYGYMTGTSQAAAIKSGKLVRQMLLAE